MVWQSVVFRGDLAVDLAIFKIGASVIDTVIVVHELNANFK